VVLGLDRAGVAVEHAQLVPDERHDILLAVAVDIRDRCRPVVLFVVRALAGPVVTTRPPLAAVRIEHRGVPVARDDRGVEPRIAVDEVAERG
jgi:hypothetical protein